MPNPGMHVQGIMVGSMVHPHMPTMPARQGNEPKRGARNLSKRMKQVTVMHTAALQRGYGDAHLNLYSDTLPDNHCPPAQPVSACEVHPADKRKRRVTLPYNRTWGGPAAVLIISAFVSSAIACLAHKKTPPPRTLQ